MNVLDKWRKEYGFNFNFNEDAEPVAELRRLRAAMARRFKSWEEEKAFYAAAPSLEEIRADIAREAEANDCSGKSGKQPR
jgi:hypothetical protein